MFTQPPHTKQEGGLCPAGPSSFQVAVSQISGQTEEKAIVFDLNNFNIIQMNQYSAIYSQPYLFIPGRPPDTIISPPPIWMDGSIDGWLDR